MKNVLVTGGAGFIGTHLVRRLLADGCKVVVLDNLSSGKRENVPASASLIVGSVLDPGAVVRALEGVDTCFHLAAVASVRQCNDDLVASHATNITGFVQILEALKGRPEVHLVYASSAAVYGANQDLPLSEQSRPAPLSPYGADKLSCELHARAAAAVFGLGSSGFRFFNVYGPGQDPRSPYSGVISKFFDLASAGRPLTIFGDGHQTRDFVFVEDVVDCLVRAAHRRSKAAEVFNVCTGIETSILDLARITAEVFGSPAQPTFGPAALGEVRRSRGSPSATAAALGFSSPTPLSDGLKRLHLAEYQRTSAPSTRNSAA